MRILIAGRGFDAPGRHEAGVFELDQARALRGAGHEVRFAALDTRSIRRPRPLGCREYELEGIRVIYAAVPGGARPRALAVWSQRCAADMIWKRLDAENWTPEIVHAHFGAALLEGARRRGIAAVYTEHASAANTDNVSSAELAREKSVCALANRVICVSRPLAERIGRRTGVTPTVVPNIVDAAFSETGGQRTGEDGAFRFVSAGGLIPRKGYDLLLKAFAKVPAETGPEVTLTIIGEGGQRGPLQELACSLGVENRVAFTGQLSRAEMAERYRASDAFVLASRRETFGVVYIEALAMGLPVIATRCGGPEDFIDESNGFLIPAEDEDALADAMKCMIARRERFDSEAIALAARRAFSPAAIAEKLTVVYEEVLGC